MEPVIHKYDGSFVKATLTDVYLSWSLNLEYARLNLSFFFSNNARELRVISLREKR